MTPGWSRKQKILLLAAAGTSLSLVYGIAYSHALTQNGADFVRICKLYLPFHCDASSWPFKWWFGGLLVCGLSFFSLFLFREELQKGRSVVACATLILLVTLVCDRFELPVGSEIVRRFNLHRFVTLVECFATLGLLFLLSQRSSLKRAVVGGTGLFLWMTSYSASLELHLLPAALVAAGAILAAALPRGRNSRKVQWVTVVVLFVAVNPLFPFWRDYPEDVFRGAGKAIQKETQPGSLLFASPRLIWLRYFSRRAMVADRKAIPIGGAPLREWERRLTLLDSAFDPNTSLSRRVEVARSFGATDICFDAQDPKLKEALETWPVKISFREDRLNFGIFVFALPPSHSP